MNNDLKELYNIYYTYEVRQIISIGLDFLSEFWTELKILLKNKFDKDNNINNLNNFNDNIKNFLMNDEKDIIENLKMIIIYNNEIHNILNLKNKNFLSWMHEFKNIRNKYSHNVEIKFRDIIRFFDTLILALEYFSIENSKNIYYKSLIIYKIYIEKMNNELSNLF